MQIRITSLSPHVSVGDGLNRGLLFFERFLPVADGQRHREIRADIKGRVNVDEVNFSFELLQKAGEHEFVVAPDKAIAEVGQTRTFLFKQIKRELTSGGGVVAGRVNLFDFLKWDTQPGGIGDTAVSIFVVFSFPNEFRLELGKRVRIAGTVGRTRLGMRPAGPRL